MTEMDEREATVEAVRSRYAAAALAVSASAAPAPGCCGDGCCSGTATLEIGDASPDGYGAEVFGAGLYPAADQGVIPAAAVAASLGCGNPLAVAELREGETVLDLGSGGGIDVLLSARRVGPTGKAFGVDMTDEMLALAEKNRREADAENVEFLKGTIEAVPLPENSVDVVISNCVINLSVDKPAVFAEAMRVLKPGGRLGITDVVAEDQLTPAERAERGEYTGCIAGALTFTEYRDGLAAAGFTSIEIDPTHLVADRMHSAIIRAQAQVPKS